MDLTAAKNRKAVPNVRLRRAREECGWSQKELVEHLLALCKDEAMLPAISEDYISRWERGLYTPSYFWRRKLCECLGKKSEELGFVVQHEQTVTNMEVNMPLQQASSPPMKSLTIPSLKRDGCFSFGKIKTTWKILDGDGIGMYQPQHIRSHYISLAEELPNELQARINRIKQEQEQKREQGLPFLWNGEIYSLDRFVIGREPINEGMTLDLWFRPSDYYTFLATNMSLKDPNLREKYLSHVDWDEPVPYFSHSFGVSLAVVTSDGYTLFTKRGKNVGTLPSTYEISVAEGLSRPIDRGANGEAPDVYRCACRGLAEELGLYEPADFSVSDIAFLSFGVSTQYALWALRGMVRIKKTINDLMTIWDNGVRDKFENQQIIPVRFTPDDVVSFVFTHQSLSLRPTIYHALVHEFGRDVVDKVIPTY